MFDRTLERRVLAAAPTCLNAGPTHNSQLSRRIWWQHMTWEWQHNRILKLWSNDTRFTWPEQENLQLCHFNRTEKNWTGGTEVRLDNTSRREKKEINRERKREENQENTQMKVVKSWQEVNMCCKSWEMVSQFATRGQKSGTKAWKSAAAPTGKPCFGSYSVALHLESSATRLAQVLLPTW